MWLNCRQKNGYWSFTYPGQELSITTAEGEHFEPSIVIERKDINDETIDYQLHQQFEVQRKLFGQSSTVRDGREIPELTNGTSNVATTYIFADD